ncbi:MAG: hypothetical protein IID44_04795 [Planctomycetes bacterium]|nr:hypothetical protein [Planctomycetota bacterium]
MAKQRKQLTPAEKRAAQAKARETRAKRTPAENAAIRKRRAKKQAERDEAKLKAILDSTPKQSKRMSTEAKLAQIRAEVAAEKKAKAAKRSKASKKAAATRKRNKEKQGNTKLEKLLANIRSADNAAAIEILRGLID